VDIAVALTDTDARLAFNGTIGLAATPTVGGKLKAEGNDLRKLIVTLVPKMTGLPPTLAQPFSVNGDIDATTPGGSIKNLVLQLADAKASGQLLVDAGPPLRADLSLVLSRLDLDKLGPAAPTAAAPAAASTPSTSATAPATGEPGGGFALPDSVEVKLALSAD